MLLHLTPGPNLNTITLPNQNKPRPPEDLIWDAGGSVLNVLPEERGMERHILIRAVTHYTIALVTEQSDDELIVSSNREKPNLNL